MNLLWLGLATLLLPFASSTPLKASEHFSSSGDAFHLREESYEANEAFVYTAKAHFVEGQAGGLLLGGSEDSGFVFNVDRYENRTKLLYFAPGERAQELASEPFIGHDGMLDGEREMILPRLRNLADYSFKVVVSVEGEKAYGEFFIDNIRRFGLDSKLELPNYEGGFVGYNTFASSIEFDDVTLGKSAYSYYAEPYRNQYHYSQFAHWNNDPNGLVYYKGYYHLYYQTNPYDIYWGDMYWGHARSKDLLHWEELPIAMFPDNGTLGFGIGNGYAWSGSAFVYHKGMSAEIDAKNWFPNGEGDGLLFVYTRDGSSAQDQVLASSDDGGMTFTRRALIPQSLFREGGKVDFRDPKIFELEEGGYGMVVSSQGLNRIVFLRSDDLLSWTAAGGFSYSRPECVDVLDVVASDGSHQTVLTIMGREYFVGHFETSGSSIRFIDQDGVDLSTLEIAKGEPMDYAKDRYATQSFYIDDDASPYCGKNISVSWWSGVPGDLETVESGSLAAFRNLWNGGGQSIPVKEGLLLDNGRYVLSETPITYRNSNLEKESLVSQDVSWDEEIENPLSEIDSNCLEVNASFEIEEGASVEFRLGESEDEWLAVGYSEESGYYLDRRNANEEASALRAYERKYETGPLEGLTNLEFKILLDHGGIEVFAGDGKYPFYAISVLSPTSRGASFLASGIGQGHLEVNAISSTYEAPAEGEGMLYLSDLFATLDLKLSTSKVIRAYDSGESEIGFRLLEGEDVIALSSVRGGVKIDAIAPGNAQFEVYTSTISKTVDVTVYGPATEEGDLEFLPSGIQAGTWNETSEGILGECKNGDGYLLSSTSLADFCYTSTLHLDGTAAGLIFRASEDMSDYVIANVDSASGVTKLFSRTSGVIAQESLGAISYDVVTLMVEAEGNEVRVYVNGSLKIETALPQVEKEEGLLGLNVFQGKARFSAPRLTGRSYDYEGGDLQIPLPFKGNVYSLKNLTQKNTAISRDLFSNEGNVLTMREAIFLSLKEGKSYRFKAISTEGAFSFLVFVGVGTTSLKLESLTILEDACYRAKLQGRAVTSLTVNGVDAPYRVEADLLVIEPEAFELGENEVVLNGSISATVTVLASKAENGIRPTCLLDYSPFQSASTSALWGLGLAFLGGLAFLTKHLVSRKD
ncbi:MAG: glycoside hydrolase family 32 protein [Candidatus Enteromonas sp.]